MHPEVCLFFQAEDGIRYLTVTGVQTCALPISLAAYPPPSVLGANDRVRVGLIGAGGRGEELLKEVLEVPNAQLVAIADVYSRRRDAAKELAPGIQTLEDHRRLLDMKDLDGVIVASPLHSH